MSEVEGAQCRHPSLKQIERYFCKDCGIEVDFNGAPVVAPIVSGRADQDAASEIRYAIRMMMVDDDFHGAMRVLCGLIGIHIAKEEFQQMTMADIAEVIERANKK